MLKSILNLKIINLKFFFIFEEHISHLYSFKNLFKEASRITIHKKIYDALKELFNIFTKNLLWRHDLKHYVKVDFKVREDKCDIVL